MPSRTRRLSPQSLDVLRALTADPGEWLYGLEISAVTGLKSGSLYPILARLAERGLLDSKWLDPQQPGRPPRHAYRVTPAGRAAARAATTPAPILIAKGAV